MLKTSNNNDIPFKTFVIIQFESNCDDLIKKWVESKINTPKEDNGAELLTCFSRNSNNEVINIPFNESLISI